MQEPVIQEPGDVGSQQRSLAWVVAPVLIFAALVAVFGFALMTGDPSKLPSALIGKPVPPVEFPALEGLTESGRMVPGFAASELKQGKVSVVNFWASWCVPCAEEQEFLVELEKRTGVPLYGVNYKDQAETARRFLGRYGNPFAAVGTDEQGRGAIEWGVYGMPETFVVNGRGEIAFKHVGPVSRESLERVLIPAITDARAAAPSSSK